MTDYIEEIKAGATTAFVNSEMQSNLAYAKDNLRSVEWLPADLELIDVIEHAL